MQMRWWVVSMVCTALTLNACDCGVETVAGKDAGVPIYDGGSTDAQAIDGAGQDAVGQDVVGQDALVDDATVQDATGQDVLASEDAAMADAAGEDAAMVEDASVSADAAGTDGSTRLDAATGADAAVASDASGPADSGASGDATLVNGPPVIDGINAADVLPGESVSLSASIDDPNLPNDRITYAWSLSSPPAGVSLQDADTATPTVVVDRAAYEGGPGDLKITVQLTVHDQAGAQDTSSAAVLTVLDERGPYIDNTSAYEGVDYASGGVRHGLCGVQAHPCNNIDDAQTNQRAAVDDGVRTETHLFVATTGSTYNRASKVLLDQSLGLVCGYDPVSWARQTGVSRTPIHFTSTYGVHVVSDAVTVEGCDIRGVSTQNPFVYTQRAAVFVESDQVVVRDNKLVGHQGKPADTPIAYGLMFNVAQATYDLDVDGNDITGGTLSQGGSTGTQAVGVLALNGLPRIHNSTILGGTADYVVGISMGPALSNNGKRARVEANDIEGGKGGDGANHGASGVIVSSGDPEIVNNTRIVGGTSSILNDGLWLASVNGRPTVSRNVITGVETASSAGVAFGILLTKGADLDTNTVSGGFATWTVGIFADGKFDNISPLAPFDFSSSWDHAEGGMGTEANGLTITSGVAATITNGVFTASSVGASPLDARGCTVGEQSSLAATATSCHGGGASRSSFGLFAASGADSVNLSNCDLSSGTISALSADGGTGALMLDDGALTIVGGTYIAGDARGTTSISVGIGMSCQNGLAVASGHSIRDASVSAGQASVSVGISIEYCANTVLENLTVSSGTANGLGSVALRGVATNLSPIGGTYTSGLARQGSSYGMVFHASATATHLIANGSNATAANARDNSIGVYFVDDVSGGALVGCTARGAQAGWSGGLAFSGVATACDIDQNDLAGGAASNLSAGLYFDRGCDGCSISRNLITGGDMASGGMSSGRSVGLRVRSRGATSTPTLIFSNRIAGGQASNARGVELSGAAGHTLRLLNNTIDGGGLAGNSHESYGVFMGQILPQNPSTQVVGVVVGNIIGPGVGGVSYNLYENSTCSGLGTVRRAQPYGGLFLIRPPGGRNNDLFPAGATGYLENATDWDLINSRCSTSVTGLGGPQGVNRIEPYAKDIIDANNKTWAVNPNFVNGYQLPSTSSLIEKAITTKDYWSGGTMLDYDGDERPHLSEYDIGCDEWTP